MNLILFTVLILDITALILYYAFIIKPIQYERAKATDAHREAEEKLQDIDRLLSDALSEASSGSHKKYFK